MGNCAWFYMVMIFINCFVCVCDSYLQSNNSVDYLRSFFSSQCHCQGDQDCIALQLLILDEMCLCGFVFAAKEEKEKVIARE